MNTTTAQLLQPNTIVQQRYQVAQMIGRGGMGAVYQARDLRLNTIVALKQTLLSGAQIDRAFEREAQLLAGLRHPALPMVTDHFIDPAGQFLVMEFVAGEDLGALVGRSPGGLPIEQVLAWADQLFEALDYLHSRQPPVIHRDIKPQNLKLAADDRLVLLDFGLAKGLASAQGGATAVSVRAYTQEYAPLEQIQGQGTDVRSDLFSAAATLYHLLAGSPPADALTRAATVIGRQPDPLVDIRRLRVDTPEGAAETLMAGLALYRDDRPGSAAVMRGAMRAVTAATTRLTPPAPAAPSPPPLPPPDLRGSTWEIHYAEAPAAAPDIIRVRFGADGQVYQFLSGGLGRPLGRWQQQHDQVQFDINRYSQWSGTVSGRSMSGSGSTPTSHWQWSAVWVVVV